MGELLQSGSLVKFLDCLTVFDNSEFTCSVCDRPAGDHSKDSENVFLKEVVLKSGNGPEGNNVESQSWNIRSCNRSYKAVLKSVWGRDRDATGLLQLVCMTGSGLWISSMYVVFVSYILYNINHYLRSNVTGWTWTGSFFLWLVLRLFHFIWNVLSFCILGPKTLLKIGVTLTCCRLTGVL